MKSVGIVRKIDELGRIVIPMEIRRIRGINPGDLVEIFVDGDNIILKKHAEIVCCSCGKENHLIKTSKNIICTECLYLFNKEGSTT